MLSHMEDCVDPRGPAYLRVVFRELAEAFGYEGKADGRVQEFAELVCSLGLDAPVPAHGDIEILSRSVNLERLKNNPIRLDQKAMEELYRQILGRM